MVYAFHSLIEQGLMDLVISFSSGFYLQLSCLDIPYSFSVVFTSISMLEWYSIDQN